MRTTRRLKIAVPTLLLGLLAVGCGSDSPPAAPSAAGPQPTGSAYPVSVTSCGKTYTYQAAPSRVVAGFPTSTETLVALGVGDAVVGYTSGSLAPKPDRVPNATEISPDYQAPRERVVAARPDLFFTNDENQLGGTDGGYSYNDLAAAKANAYVLGGYCMNATAATTIDTVYQDVTNLGTIFAVPDRARAAVTDMKTRIDNAAGRQAGKPKISVAFVQVFDRKLYALSGGNYKITLDTIGVTNTFAGISENFAEISPEQVLTLKPDALFVIYDSETTKATQLDEATKLLASTPAATNGRVTGLLNADLSAGGVSLTRVLEQAAQAAYP